MLSVEYTGGASDRQGLPAGQQATGKTAGTPYMPEASSSSSDASSSTARCCTSPERQPGSLGVASKCSAASGCRRTQRVSTLAASAGSGELPTATCTGGPSALAVRQLRQQASIAEHSCATWASEGKCWRHGTAAARTAPAGHSARCAAATTAVSSSAGRSAHPACTRKRSSSKGSATERGEQCVEVGVSELGWGRSAGLPGHPDRHQRRLRGSGLNLTGRCQQGGEGLKPWLQRLAQFAANQTLYAALCALDASKGMEGPDKRSHGAHVVCAPSQRGGRPPPALSCSNA